MPHYLHPSSWLLVTYFWLSLISTANGATLNESTKSIGLSPLLEYREALSFEATPEDLATADDRWQAVESDPVNLGFQEAAFWLKGTFTTGKLTTTDWILEQPYPLIDQLNVFIYRDKKLEYQWFSGDSKPFPERALSHAHFLFPIQLKENSSYQIFIKVQNTEAMELPLRLMQYNYFTTADNQRAVIDGIFYGFLIIMAAYNLVLYLNIRDRSYLYYVAYVVSMLLFFMSQKGVLYQYFFPYSPTLHHYSIPFILMMALHSIAYFFKDFLSLPEQTPRIWLVIKGILIFNILSAILVFVLSYQTVIFLIIGNAAFAASFALGIAIHLSRSGQKTAQMVLAGWTLLIICIVFMTLSKMGIFYNDFMAEYGMRLGTSFEILIFSFALSYRINEERQAKEAALKQVNSERSERIRAQELALQHEVDARQAKEEALTQQKLLNENLEQLVHERTATLEKTLVDLEKANKELELLSSKDGLTGIFNRRAFDERILEEWARSSRDQLPLSLLMVDIDYFKKINDTKGHQCGDYVLKEITKQMKLLVSRPTDLIARYGGEEFAVLLQNTPKKGAEHVATELVSHIAQHSLTWEGLPFTVTISIGLHTMLASDSQSFESLIAAADGALYNAKQNGRNQWVSVN
ncbi:MAG: diguanylate cyclase [Pseudomonadales bacterium]|nr:diguanylate cyclase [Pseudomonadales bacterium]